VEFLAKHSPQAAKLAQAKSRLFYFYLTLDTFEVTSEPEIGFIMGSALANPPRRKPGFFIGISSEI